MPVHSLTTDTRTLISILEQGNVLVITGAGISTDSGIPDYRGPSGAAQRRHAPMTYQTFRKDPKGRHRYWARSHLGWPHMAAARPNAGHYAIAEWEKAGLIRGVITQNVDGLHQKAGSRVVLDLHGRLDSVVCLECGHTISRHDLHHELTHANPHWQGMATLTNPDGDAELDEAFIDSFHMVDCPECGGALKPDVVYFGENVPVHRVEQATSWTDQASSVLVLGSTLTVFSARRFVSRAHKADTPIVIVNQGATRCDDIAALTIHAPLSDLLPHVTASVNYEPGGPLSELSRLNTPS